MRNKKSKTDAIVQGSIVSLALLLMGGEARGQAPAPPSPGTEGPELRVQTGPANAFSMAFSDKVETVKGHGYQADAVTETVQTLGDGSHINHKMIAAVARDAEGRTMRTETLDGMGLWGGQSERPVKITMVFDPVAGTHIHWQSDAKTATVMPMPPKMGPIGNTSFYATAGPVAGVVSSAGVVTSGNFTTGAVAGGGQVPLGSGPDTVIVRGAQDRGMLDQPEKPDTASSNVTTEQLGSRMIDGVEAVGTRVTEVIPAGTIGNEKDLITTRETWFSPELKIVVSSIRNDPRFGQIRYTLSNIQLTEPDPSLFQPPVGYTVIRPRVAAIQRETP